MFSICYQYPFSSLIIFRIHSILLPQGIFLSAHWLLVLFIVLILINCFLGMLYNHHLTTFFFGLFSFYLFFIVQV